MPLGPTGGRIMAEIVAAALAAHAPLITGKPEIARPEQRERLYAGFHEMRRRLAAARPDLLVMFVNDHLQNFPYSNLRSEEHTSELQSHVNLVCRLLLEKKKNMNKLFPSLSEQNNATCPWISRNH